ncbi:hypothetical protein ATANTOWER_026936 [Ataeniobius toweri]|uniref:Uncharacterized protein n=1 Tax=Ataeniobius toweri TaxID=208326 RepID=A0ABU7B9Q0_9TELE|nr:hypothetical protein [Ataeniobius toweri]
MSTFTWEVNAENCVFNQGMTDHKIPSDLEMKEEQEEPEPKLMTEIKAEPESQPIKEEVELWIPQDEEQLVMKQEMDAFMLPAAYEERLHRIRISFIAKFVHTNKERNQNC